MKKIIHYIFLASVSTFVAQNTTSTSVTPNATLHPATFEKSECITDTQRQQVRAQIAINKLQIEKNRPGAFQKRGGAPLFISPIEPKAGFNDPGYYIVNFQVDQNLSPNGNLTDYECNERTYDWASGNHEGTDYVIWPYPWKRMQEEVMQIVAAASGTIIDKRDGNFDLNCNNNRNPNWNGIIVEHSDGSQAWYWHFKDGAITTKNIGDTVEAGEYLGAAGSSGSSSIPHLHFEVYDADDNLIDPYQGPCNNMNAESWWASQPDYYVPTINKLSTHNSANFDTVCGQVEDTYEALDFLPGDEVIFRIFYRDIQTNSETHIVVKDPNDVVLYDYVFTSAWPNYEAAYAEWLYTTDNTWVDGVYTITAEFEGNVYETVFGINTTLAIEENAIEALLVYPNPAQEKVVFEHTTVVQSIEIVDLTGKKVMEITPATRTVEVDVSTLNSGVYMAIITSEGKRTVKKVLKR